MTGHPGAAPHLVVHVDGTVATSVERERPAEVERTRLIDAFNATRTFGDDS